MKTFALILMFITIPLVASAQDSTITEEPRPLNNINVKFLGEVQLISLNYERLFVVHSNIFISAQLGIGYNEEFHLWGSSSASDQYLIIPHHISVNFGKRKNHIEIGLSGSGIQGERMNTYVLSTIFGYRLQPARSNKVNLRFFGYIPLVNKNIVCDPFAYWPIGISLGYCF